MRKVRALPRCSAPVGDGARRVIPSDTFRSFCVRCSCARAVREVLPKGIAVTYTPRTPRASKG